MGTVTVRNLDDEVVRRLKQRAVANKRSLEAELRDILEQESLKVGLDARRLAFVERARQIRAMTPREVEQTDSVLLIREDRQRHHGRD